MSPYIVVRLQTMHNVYCQVKSSQDRLTSASLQVIHASKPAIKIHLFLHVQCLSFEHRLPNHCPSILLFLVLFTDFHWTNHRPNYLTAMFYIFVTCFSLALFCTLVIPLPYTNFSQINADIERFSPHKKKKKMIPNKEKRQN